jgi:hypothetical protein
MRAIAATAIALVIGAIPALAQSTDPYKMKLEAEKKAHEEAEKDYNNTMRRIRSTGPMPKSDPWKVVRPEDKKPEEPKKK